MNSNELNRFREYVHSINPTKPIPLYEPGMTLADFETFRKYEAKYDIRSCDHTDKHGYGYGMLEGRPESYVLIIPKS